MLTLPGSVERTMQTFSGNSLGIHFKSCSSPVKIHTQFGTRSKRHSQQTPGTDRAQFRAQLLKISPSTSPRLTPSTRFAKSKSKRAAKYLAYRLTSTSQGNSFSHSTSWLPAVSHILHSPCPNVRLIQSLSPSHIPIPMQDPCQCESQNQSRSQSHAKPEPCRAIAMQIKSQSQRQSHA